MDFEHPARSRHPTSACRCRAVCGDLPEAGQDGRSLGRLLDGGEDGFGAQAVGAKARVAGAGVRADDVGVELRVELHAPRGAAQAECVVAVVVVGGQGHGPGRQGAAYLLPSAGTASRYAG